jgi:hypothetical protein
VYLPCHCKQYNKPSNVQAAGNPGVTSPVHVNGNRCPKLEKLELPIVEGTNAGVTYFNTNVS